MNKHDYDNDYESEVRLGTTTIDMKERESKKGKKERR